MYEEEKESRDQKNICFYGMHACMHTCQCMYMQAGKHEGKHAMPNCGGKHACMHAYVFMHVHACMYVGRQACRETNRQTGMQTCSTMYVCLYSRAAKESALV